MTVDATRSYPPKEINHSDASKNESKINKIQVLSRISFENSDLILTIQISVCNRPVKLLIDTGAHATMIRSNCIRTNVLYYPQIRYCIVGINGPNNSIRTHGATYGNLNFNGVQLKQQLQIAGEEIHLNYDGILGMDFLKTYSAILDIENSTMTCNLPPWHNLYETQERSAFESKFQQNLKQQIGTKIIYFSKENDMNTVAPKIPVRTKKLMRMETRIDQCI